MLPAAASAAGRAAAGRAGAARADLTPPLPVLLAGYHRAEPAHAVRDALTATVLALACGDERPLLVVSLDHVGPLVREADALRQYAAGAASLPAERVLLLATHTHSAPEMTPAYLAFAGERIAAAAARAVAVMRPARAGWGEAPCDAAVNRRARDAAGRACHGENPAGPVDRRVAVLRVEGEDGAPIAALAVYGAHGNVWRGDANAVSADWPAEARRFLEGALGCPVAMAIGAAGNVNPRWRGSEEALRRTGLAVGASARTAWDAARPAPLTDLALDVATLPLALLPLPDEAEIARLTREVREHWDCDVSAWRAEMARLRAAGRAAPEAIPLAIGALRVNGGILAGLPLEPFAESALAAAERLPGVPLYVAGCANGWIGYLPVAGEYAAGGYEVDWAPTVYGLESGWVRPARPEMAERVTETIVRLARGAGKAAASRG